MATKHTKGAAENKAGSATEEKMWEAAADQYIRQKRDREKLIKKTVRTHKGIGEVERNDRGFEVIEFKDYYDNGCTLLQSSLAHYEQPGSSAIWLGTNGEGNCWMHLSLEQVKALILNLQRWVDTGSFTTPPPSRLRALRGKKTAASFLSLLLAMVSLGLLCGAVCFAFECRWKAAGWCFVGAIAAMLLALCDGERGDDAVLTTERTENTEEGRP